MALLRDLVRDLVGIIFPGALVILLLLWLFWGLMVIFGSSQLLIVFLTGKTFYTFSILLIFSYIAGQLLRIKQLRRVEEVCTKHYRKKRAAEFRKKHKIELSKEKFEESVENLDKMEERYFAGDLELKELRNVYKEHNKKFSVWEEFPYPYQSRARRLLHQSIEYNRFFDKYEEAGLTKDPTLFHFFKSVIYEYSPSFKEEVLRQESLVRLFSGIYYAIKFGVMVNIIVGILYLAAIATFHFFSNYRFYENMNYSHGIALTSAIALLTFWYMKTEILSRLRFMRVKELSLAFDGFYLICKQKGFDF